MIGVVRIESVLRLAQHIRTSIVEKDRHRALSAKSEPCGQTHRVALARDVLPSNFRRLVTAHWSSVRSSYTAPLRMLRLSAKDDGRSQKVGGDKTPQALQRREGFLHTAHEGDSCANRQMVGWYPRVRQSTCSRRAQGDGPKVTYTMCSSLCAH
eukprot:SAG11_NODE_619_length_8173_cov_4.837255_8_plen_154_part_00